MTDERLQQLEARETPRALRLSRLGYGAAPLGNVYGEIDPDVGIASVHQAIALGVTFFDVSPYYGLTRAEEALGRALVGRREQVTLCTKAGRDGPDAFDFSARHIRESVEQSLRRLRTEYVDVLLAHDIEFGQPEQILGETIGALERLRAEGKCRFIGVSAYPLAVLRQVVATCQVDIALSYCHDLLYNTRLRTELLPLAQRRGVTVINASPLGMGLLSDGGPPAWHPAPQPLKNACAQAAAFCRERGVSLAEVALQFSLQTPGVSSTVVGMATPELVNRNVAALRSQPNHDILRAVRAILQPVEGATWPSGRPEWVALEQVAASEKG